MVKAFQFFQSRPIVASANGRHHPPQCPQGNLIGRRLKGGALDNRKARRMGTNRTRQQLRRRPFQRLPGAAETISRTGQSPCIESTISHRLPDPDPRKGRVPVGGIFDPFLAFGLETDQGRQYFNVSNEIRREKGEVFSLPGGLDRNFELMYVFASERDILIRRGIRE